MGFDSKRPITIQDVAERAQVSTKTVSRVINNESGVNAETRAHVARVVREMDYRPNINARGLAGDRSYLIGLFIEKPGSYVAGMQTGIIGRCRESDMHLMIEPWDPADPDLAGKVSKLLRQLRLEAAILLPAHCDNPVILDALVAERIPFVRIAPKFQRGDSPVIGTHDYLAARMMTAHLLSLGHRRIAFVRGCPTHSADQQRYQGFADELALQGVALDPALVVKGDFRFEIAEISARELLSKNPRPTAVFAGNDDMAAAVIAVASELGISVPEEMSVAGFDDSPVSRMVSPKITTVRQPVEEIGRAAADLIISCAPRRNGWPDPMPNKLLNFELVLRQSTAPART